MGPPGHGRRGAERPAGRAARSNPPVRFDRLTAEAADDGWESPGPDRPAGPRTELARDASRTILTRNSSPDVPFDRSINPYRGCEHGCIYCFARPTHAWLGLSPGLDFETRLTMKPDAPALLRKELSRKGYAPAPVALGTNTDPYQPVERRLRLTRQILEVLAAFRHPFTITTKGAAVVDDIDIIAPEAAAGRARVAVSITTLDPRLARAMEPRAATPDRRLAALRALADAGIPASVMVAPVIPGLTDHEIEAILQAAREAGAVRAAYICLRLPLEVKDLFGDWLEAVLPGRAAKVRAAVRQIHGGRDYDPRWGTRMAGEGPIAELIGQRFSRAARRLSLDGPLPPLDCSAFEVPGQADRQLSLF
ncbi:MAG: PA0069 family radical SAM protein [Alphaproteobacteria bacterium]|nr:PA0069 family radical SAM protein [Alphaproteobacteria bacterium]